MTWESRSFPCGIEVDLVLEGGHGTMAFWLTIPQPRRLYRRTATNCNTCIAQVAEHRIIIVKNQFIYYKIDSFLQDYVDLNVGWM